MLEHTNRNILSQPNFLPSSPHNIPPMTPLSFGNDLIIVCVGNKSAIVAPGPRSGAVSANWSAINRSDRIFLAPAGLGPDCLPVAPGNARSEKALCLWVLIACQAVRDRVEPTQHQRVLATTWRGSIFEHRRRLAVARGRCCITALKRPRQSVMPTFWPGDGTQVPVADWVKLCQVECLMFNQMPRTALKLLHDARAVFGLEGRVLPAISEWTNRWNKLTHWWGISAIFVHTPCEWCSSTYLSQFPGGGVGEGVTLISNGSLSWLTVKYEGRN